MDLVKGIASSRRAQEAFTQLDFSKNIDRNLLSPSAPLPFAFEGQITCQAYDPVQSLFACATDLGIIHLWGSPSVYISWAVSPKCHVKYLSFSSGTNIFVAIDQKNTLHVYDLEKLDSKQRPTRTFVHSLRSTVTCFENPPALDHMFIGYKDGSVEAFDLDRLRLSPYRIHNLWLEQEELLRRSGIPNAPSRRHIPMCVDISINPVDLNQLLVAYEGGAVLFDLKEHKAVSTFEMIVLPGAPGGGNELASDRFAERRPALTCVAWRSDGLLFASGHVDGCITFWSPYDGDKPVLVQTIDRIDANIIKESDVFDTPDDSSGTIDIREPIYRMAWSSYSEEHPSSIDKNCTHLTFFGGGRSSQPKGLYIMTFPPYQAPYTAFSYHYGEGLSPESRKAFRDSIIPSERTIYLTPTCIEDFILIPRSNPHYSMSFDPTAVIVNLSPPSHLNELPAPRRLECYKFPPEKEPSLVKDSSYKSLNNDKIKDNTEAENIETSKQIPQLLPVPERMLWSGDVTVQSFQIYVMPQFSLSRLGLDPNCTLFKGGKASPSHGGNTRLASNAHTAPGRLMVTLHFDGSLRFWDCSDSLLMTPETQPLHNTPPPTNSRSSVGPSVFAGWLKKPFPHLLLTLDVNKRFAPSLPINKYHFSPDTLQSAVQYGDYTIRVFRLRSNRSSYVLPTLDPEDLLDDGFHAEPNSPPVTHPVYEDLTKRTNMDAFGSFQEIGRLQVPSNKINVLEISKCGFLTVAWGNEICVVDLNSGDLILQSKDHEQKQKKERGHGEIKSIFWIVSPLGNDQERHLRLVCAYQSGHFRVWTLKHTLDTWVVSPDIVTFNHKGVYNPFYICIVNPLGKPMEVTKEILTKLSYNDDGLQEHEHEDLYAIMLVVSDFGVYAFLNIDGRSGSEVEAKRRLIQASWVQHIQGDSVLVTYSEDGSIKAYLLPSLLEYNIEYGDKKKSISPSDVNIGQDGSFVKRDGLANVNLYNLNVSDVLPSKPFIFPPAFDLHDSTIKLPPHPANPNIVASAIASWWTGSSSMSEAIDSRLGGPDRPAKKVPEEEQEEQGPDVGTGKRPQNPSRTSSFYNTQFVQNASSSARSATQQARDALSNRGEHLDKLGESFNQIGQSSKDMIDEARTMMFKESAKGKFRSWFG